jgi:hypothetical protein
VIVRLMGEGQFRVHDDVIARLNELDDRAQVAIDAEDEPELDRCLDEMWSLVRGEGEELSADDLSSSDVVVPPSDLTLEETKRLMSHEGFIPDIPAPSA